MKHFNINSKDSKQKLIAPNHKKLKKAFSVVTETGDGKNYFKIDPMESKTSNGELLRKGKVAYLAESTEENKAATVASSNFNRNNYAQKKKENSESTMAKNNFNSNKADETGIEDGNSEYDDYNYIIFPQVGMEDDENTQEQNNSNKNLSNLKGGQETDNGNVSDIEPYVIQKVYTSAPDSSEDSGIYRRTEPVTDFQEIRREDAVKDSSTRQEHWDRDSSHHSTDYEIQTKLNEYASGLLKRITKSANNLKSTQSDLPDEYSPADKTEKFAEENIDGKDNADRKPIEKASLVQYSTETETEEDYVEKNPQYQSETYYDSQDDSKDAQILTTPVEDGLTEEELQSESSIKNVIIKQNDHETAISENRIVALKTSKKKNLKGSKLHKHNNGIKDRKEWKFRVQTVNLEQIQKPQSKPQTDKNKKINGAEKRRLIKNNHSKALDRYLHTLPRGSHQTPNSIKKIQMKTHKSKGIHKMKRPNKKTRRIKKIKIKTPHYSHSVNKIHIRMRHIYIFMTCGIIILIVVTLTFQLYVVILKSYSKNGQPFQLYTASIWSNPLKSKASSLKVEERRAILEEELISTKLAKDIRELKKVMENITEKMKFMDSAALRQTYESDGHYRALKRKQFHCIH
ncbi:hypothetical protein TNCT_726381 [Trichonephila clavata]|uniref:Uncharacterized protein n=1 Tax=Trichonephila clavata TaxID=2740835 RepID=A0A8X6FDL3_TRICU|nr:hypothetical protein TNCT_726381 [Trichonephila clavata]